MAIIDRHLASAAARSPVGRASAAAEGLVGGSSASCALAATTLMLSMINAGLGKHGRPVLAAFAAYLALGEVSEARSQPAVLGRYVFIGATTGVLYALDSDSGCTLWGFRAASGIRGGAVIGEAAGTAAVFFSDGAANVYAVNAQSGKLIWKVRPVDHFAALATATPPYYKGVLYQAFSSFEEGISADPKYQCCTFRGSVVALSAANGDTLWQTFTIPDPARPTLMSPAGTQQYGPSGAAVWATPHYR